MTIKSSLLFARSLIFPKTEKKSSARRSLFGALICIGLSIIPLIVVISISNGMIKGMTDRIIGLSSNHLQAYVASNIEQTKTAESFKDYAETFLQFDGVTAAYPEVNLSALATSKTFRTGAQVRAVPSDIFKSNHYFKELFEIQDGSLESFETGEEKVALIGQKMAKTLMLGVGDSIRIISTRTVGDKISPKVSTYKVGAVISSGYQELDQFWVFIPFETAYTSLSLSSATYTIMLETLDAYSPDLVRIQHIIQKKVGRYANVYRWDQLHSSEFENFSSTKVMLVFVMALIVLVASINISSAIIMLVMERKKEIAILKSIGATPKGITLSFLITGLACGGGGLCIGLPIGLIIALNATSLITILEKIVNWFAKIGYIFKGIPLDQISEIKLMDPAYYIQKITFDLPANQIIFIVVGTLLLSVIVSIIPAIKAGKEKPLDILRKV